MVLAAVLAAALYAPGGYPGAAEGDHVLRDFRFQTGETIRELRLHYRTIGSPQRDASGAVTNAVLILHGTGGSGQGFLEREYFHAELFEPGQPLDASRYFVIFPDGIGHGRSSKPSDGMKSKFPRYGYRDMVEAQRRLLAERFQISRLRLILGTSMGCMHGWVWATEFPDAVDAIMPLACAPRQISGRNLLWRKMTVDLLRENPKNYKAFRYVSLLMGSNTLELQKRAPTRKQAEAVFEKTRTDARPVNAVDTIYQLESSWDYDPSPKLESIKARVTAINFADDPINPPELGIFERECGRVPGAKCILMPATPDTYGHGNHSRPAMWKQHLVELLVVQGRSI